MSRLPDVTEILIIGAGPSGLALAAELYRRGLSPLILDRQIAGANTSRAAVVHARTLEVLKPLGVVDDLLNNGVVVPVFKVRDRDHILMEADFRNLKTEYPFTLMCPQDRTEAILLKRLQDLGGAVLRPVDVVGVRQTLHGAEVDVMAEDGPHMIKTKWLIGCDGAHSIVRQSANIAFEGGRYDESFVLADVRMDWPISRDEVSLFFAPAGLVVVAPLPDNRFRIVATAAEAPENPDIGFLEQILAERGPTKAHHRIDEVVWSSRFHIQHRVVDSLIKYNVLLCGDAAHVHSPAGGQGMNTGIQDAVSLAEPLAQVNATGNRLALEDWALKRHEIAKIVVGVTDRMTRAATLGSAPARLLRNAALGIVGHLPGVSNLIAHKLAELDNR